MLTSALQASAGKSPGVKARMAAMEAAQAKDASFVSSSRPQAATGKSPGVKERMAAMAAAQDRDANSAADAAQIRAVSTCCVAALALKAFSFCLLGWCTALITVWSVHDREPRALH